jgi:broad specificity phosphatase PhoE
MIMNLLTRAITTLFAATALAAFATTGLAAQGTSATTAIVVRHAEKAATPADDPKLSALGEVRARDLYDAIKDAGVSAVITTQYVRTKQTAQPTVDALSLPTEVVVTTASAAAHARDVAAAVRAHAGHTVLVVGHSNTVPAIIEALGAKRPAPICDAEYDNLYIVTIAPDGRAGVIRSKFGARTPVEVNCATMK